MDCREARDYIRRGGGLCVRLTEEFRRSGSDRYYIWSYRNGELCGRWSDDPNGWELVGRDSRLFRDGDRKNYQFEPIVVGINPPAGLGSGSSRISVEVTALIEALQALDRALS